MEIFKAIIFGIVEGVTEWLPVSSTGHMLILDEFIKLSVSEEFKNIFLVVIQLGAILAVLIQFFNQLCPIQKKEHTISLRKDKIILWEKIILSCLPAAVIGILFDHLFEKWFYHAFPVAMALIIFGIAFLVIEFKQKGEKPKITAINDLTFSMAFMIGIFQLIAAIFPGTSRSGATIVGALLLGVSRTVASEFTFYLAVLVMFGASLLKILQYGLNFTKMEWVLLGTGMLTAFLVSMFVIKKFMKYVKQHNFVIFGWYRILLGFCIILLNMYQTAVTDNRINEFVFKAVLHVLVYAYMELAAIVIERPGTDCNTARPVPRPRRHRRGPPRSLQGAKAPYIWPASFCNTSRQSCSYGFQRLSPVPLDGAAGHSHHRADLAVRQFQDTMQYQDALSRLGQAGKGSGHQPVADLKLTAIGRKYKTVAGVLIYRA